MPLSIKLDAETEKRIEDVAGTLAKSKSWVIREAVRYYAEEVADYEIALERLADPDGKLIDHEEVKRVLGLVD